MLVVSEVLQRDEPRGVERRDVGRVVVGRVTPVTPPESLVERGTR